MRMVWHGRLEDLGREMGFLITHPNTYWASIGAEHRARCGGGAQIKK